MQAATIRFLFIFLTLDSGFVVGRFDDWYFHGHVIKMQKSPRMQDAEKEHHLFEYTPQNQPLFFDMPHI